MSEEPDGRERDIAGHLQAAARELIAAARSALDALEEVVAEPSRLLKAPSRPPAPPPAVERIEVDVERPADRDATNPGRTSRSREAG